MLASTRGRSPMVVVHLFKYIVLCLRGPDSPVFDPRGSTSSLRRIIVFYCPRCRKMRWNRVMAYSIKILLMVDYPLWVVALWSNLNNIYSTLKCYKSLVNLPKTFLGWPSFHQSTVHSSPLLFDIDKDGTREIALATYNGVVNFFRPSGYMMNDKLEVPRRKVRKDWYVGLHPDPVDRSHPDIHDPSLVPESTLVNSTSQINGSTMGVNAALSTEVHKSPGMNESKTENEPAKGGQTIKLPTDSNNSTRNGESVASVGQNSTHTQRRLLEDGDRKEVEDAGSKSGMKAATVENNEALEDDADSSFDLFRDGDELADEYNYDYDDYIDESMWKDENWQEGTHEKLEDYVGVDSHILCTPVIADIDNDGISEMIVAVSYFFDREYYDNPDHLSELGGIDIEKYVAGSIVVFNLDTKQVKWTRELDLSIDTGAFRGYIYSSPTVVDLDGDGNLDILVGTSYGLCYVLDHHELGGIDIEKYVAGSIVVFNLDTKQVKWTRELDLSIDTGAFRGYIYSSPTVVDLDGDGNLDILVGTSYGLCYVLDHHGNVREKFPLEMAEIQAPVIAADINDDGKIEIVTADSHGNVAAWTAQGDELWEGFICPQSPTVGDVDGDGHTDIVVPTISGNIYVLSGKDGSFVRPFPYRTHGRVMSQVLLLDLSNRKEKQKSLTLITTSFDGYLYLIDGKTACADVVDIGETSYSMVLADNVDGGDDLDLIVSTMNGNVFCFSTPSLHHPLKAWRSSNQGRNNVAIGYNREGIYVSPSSRSFRDEEGKHFWVEMEIFDNYRVPSGHQGPYNVTTTLLVPGNYQGERRIMNNQIITGPGKQRVKLPTVPVRTTGTVLVDMVDKNGLHFSDEFSLTFHMHYYKLLKWLLLLPMLGMFGMLVILRPQEDAPLPSFSRNTDL
ncbi:hypothetical protein Taro_052827 [Colocasia esculenta]|uniref:DEX1 C-terminal domain-containing protein n=1 Tax=Colocasia esculenta TaxID=4460 RepID=A0A843XKU9_COLES|nr:hypothetical protein [Colocasia esculenta]